MREILEDICCSEVRVVVGEGSLSKLSKIKDNNAAVIYSRKISIADKINKYLPNAYFIPINDGESTKELSSVISLVEKLFEKNFDRGDYIIGVGGGTVTDVAGFLASIYLRGLNLINVPTTFLGMVDAAIGGKNGVNFNNIKNLIGTFYQPSMIISDLEFLETLPIEELKKGLAEVIKYGLTLDKDYIF